MQLRYGTRGKLISSPPHPPRRKHFLEKIFKCPFQYPKVPLETGAPTIFWCFLRPCTQWRHAHAFTVAWIFKRAKEKNCQNNIQTFDAIKPEKLFKIVEIKKQWYTD
jgi:hypothetical protein